MAATAFLRDVLLQSRIIYPRETTWLPTACVYSNESQFDAAWAAHLMSVPYAGRSAEFDPVQIGRLPEGTMLKGSHHFILSVESVVVSESIPHVLRADPCSLDQVVSEQRPPATIGDECLLLARYGHGTWGHWAGEMLPIAAAVEAAMPGRFRYAIPQAGHVDFVTGMLQSLALYGIGIHRLVWVRQGFDQSFKNAWAVTPIWSGHAPHPAALGTLRKATTPDNAGPEKIALMRRDWPTRAIANAADVAAVLTANGFHLTDMAGVRFADQVQQFRSARSVFAVLGSGLTGLVYAPDGVGVIAASPAGFSDRFFYALAQSRGGRWADVKGQSEWNGKDGMLRDAPFEVPIKALKEALAAV